MVGLSTSLPQPADAAAHYLHWGVVQISLANLLIILAMIAVFVLALVLPFPGWRAEARRDVRREEEHDDRH